jgi:acyl carrier protein
MTRTDITTRLKEIITPYVQDQSVLAGLSESSELVAELHINSMHLIDIVLDVEAAFDIEITADEADKLKTIGDALDLIETKTPSS